MGAIGGVFGLSGGQNGTGVSGPEQANLQTAVDPAQTATSYAQNQSALGQQQGLLNALQAQNGLQNQSQVYGQLQGIANGTGPNPAQAMLNQQTGQNIQNQAALMAGQRGAGANVGLMARQAGQQGGALQQQAVGQGATMQANQSLNAIGQAGNIANNQVANQIGATGAMTAAQQAEQSNLLNALSARNTAQAGSQSSVNAGNTALANTTMQGQQALIGGVMNNLGGGAIMGKAMGGDVGSIGGDGGIPLQGAINAPAPQQGPASSFGQFLSNVGTGGVIQQAPSETTTDSGADALYKGASGASLGGDSDSGGGGGIMGLLSLLAKGGQVSRQMIPVVVSPGEKIIPPGNVSKAAGGKVDGKRVPGKAMVPGDSEKNDVVKTKLPAGSIVVPRTKSKNKKDSAAFVRMTLAKRGRK